MDKEIKIAKSKGFNNSDIDDLVAVCNIKSGKEREFAKIMDKYYGIVLRKMLSYYNGDSEKAEDGASDVMVKILQSLDKWSAKDGKFKSWVYKITYTTFIDTYRKDKRNTNGNSVSIDSLFRNDVGESQNQLASLQIADEDLNADEIIEKKEMISKMIVALNELTDIEKKIIELRYFSGMRFDVISETVNVNESTCRVTSRRAILKLKELLK